MWIFLKNWYRMIYIIFEEGVTMNSIQEEQQEYEKFMFELTHKAHEVQQDFNKLSDNNKKKVLTEVDKVFVAKGLVGVLNYIIKQN